VLVRLSLTGEPDGQWLSDSGRRHSVLVALGLVPFAGIAFLWFIGVVRDRIGESEDRFFATVFLGSGLLFVAMMFAAAAVAGALATSAGGADGSLIGPGTWKVGQHLVFQFMSVYAMRMAAVFMIATSTILLHTRTAPRWLATLGFVAAAVLLVLSHVLAWVELVLPAWVIVVCAHILLAGFKRTKVVGSP
jgi:hypothetical protein